MSGSLRLSRASTRTSLASDDLDKYMTNNAAYGDFNENLKKNIHIKDSVKFEGEPQQSTAIRAQPQPRIPSARILSGRSQDTIMANMNRSHGEREQQVPPPIKVIKFRFFFCLIEMPKNI
jgi:hypothetical protein